MNKIQNACDLLPNVRDASFLGGFNQRVLGDPFNQTLDAWDKAVRGMGWHKANEMIMNGLIYSVHAFPHSDCPANPFPYGGTWVCNYCNRNNLDKPWWRIKVYKDGDAWCCVGENFEDLQASDNYSFGDSREAAIANYGRLMDAHSAVVSARRELEKAKEKP